MIIKEGSPEEIYHWFTVEKTTEVILCIFLCRNPSQIAVLEECVQRAFEIDAVIGKKIGFLFLGDGIGNLVEFNRGLGESVVLPGKLKKMVVDTDPIPMRSFVSNFNLNSLKKSEYAADQDNFKLASRILAESSSRVVPEFCTYFKIDSSNLPGMMMMYKGFEEAQYFKFGCDVDADELINFFRNLVEISDSVERDLIGKKLYTHEMHEILSKYKDLSNELDAKKRKIETAVFGLCRKYDIEDTDCQRMIGALTSIKVSIKIRDDLLSEMKTLKPHSLKDGRWNKVELLSNYLREKKEEINDLISPRKPIDIMDRINEENSKIEKIRDMIDDLQVKWDKGTSGSSQLLYGDLKPSRSLWQIVERVNTAWELSDKAKKLLVILSAFVSSGPAG